jgi:bifunctional enzyme CysN/CysC
VSADIERGGVVWITGYSASGKTSVGRRVESLLRARGLRTAFLDGDDLRSILAQRWGYSREDRVDLARVYFRLCSHLASQGLTVVIAAVAMYDEVREWLHEHVPGSHQIYLRVPLDERERRDASTKKLYRTIGQLADMYDEPKHSDLVIDNHGGVTVDDVARRVCDYYSTARHSGADLGREGHWASYYAAAQAPTLPSSFAEWVMGRVEVPQRILEVGCGNGRDAVYFSTLGHGATGIDRSSSP